MEEQLKEILHELSIDEEGNLVYQDKILGKISTWQFTAKWRIGKVKPCKDYTFNGIPCLCDDQRYGFFRLINSNHYDKRPGHAIWIGKKDTEYLYHLFRGDFT